VQVEADVVDGRTAEVPHRQGDTPRLVGRAVEVVVNVPPDHPADEFLPVDAGRRLRADRLPVAEHRDAVGQAENLFQAVGDVDDAHALAAEAPQSGEEGLRLGLRERAGGLVQHQHPRLTGEGPGDLDKLPVGDGQSADRLVDVVQFVQVQRTDQGAGVGPHGGAAQAAQAGGLAAHVDVLGHRQVRRQGQFLVDDADAESVGVGDAADVDRPVVDPDGPGVGGVDAAQDLDEGGFARPVLAQQGVDLSGEQLEAHVIQRGDPAEPLGHALQTEERRLAEGRTRRRRILPRSLFLVFSRLGLSDHVHSRC